MTALIRGRAGTVRSQGRTTQEQGGALVLRLLRAQRDFGSMVLNERRVESLRGAELDPDLDELALIQGGAGQVIIPAPDPPLRYQLWRAVTRVSRPLVTGSRVLAGSLAAGLVSLWWGLGRPDWAIVTVVIMLRAAPSRRVGTVRGVHRTIGTVAGLVFFYVIWSVDPGPWLIIALVGTCQAFAEVFIVRNYALTVFFTTPLALITGGAVNLSPGTTLSARLLEVVVAVICGMAALWVVFPRGLRGIYLSVSRLAGQRTEEIRGLLEQQPVRSLIEPRRILRYELAGTANAAVDAAHDDPVWMKQRWPQHHAAQDEGFRILTLAARSDARLASSQDLA